MQVYPGIINPKHLEALSFQHFSLNPVGYCSDHTQVNLISDLIFLSFTSKIVREKRAVAEELLIQLTWSSCIKTPGLDGLLCISLSEKKVENSPLEFFGPSWLSNVKCKVQTAISSQVGFHNVENRSFHLALPVFALSGIGATHLLNSVNFLSDAREPKNSLCPRGKQASSTLCHRVLSSSSSSSWLEAWTGKSLLDSCSLHVLSRVWLLYRWSFRNLLPRTCVLSRDP